MTVGISIALNGRTVAAEAAITHYAGLALDGVILHAVGSSDDDAAMAEAAGWLYTHAPNDNLGVKRNAGLAALRDAGASAVIRIGSDDLIHAPLLSRMIVALRAGARGVIIRGSFVMDDETGEAIELYRTDYALGIGAPVFDAYGWELYGDGSTSAPDMMISAYVSGSDVVTVHSTCEEPFLQIKSASSINTFERIKAREIWRPVVSAVVGTTFDPAETDETGLVQSARKRRTKLAKSKTIDAASGLENE